LTIHIRLATSADGPAIAQVNVTTWRTQYRGIVPDDVLDGLDAEARGARMAADLANPERRSRAAVAVDEALPEQPVVGYAWYGPERADDALYTGEIYALYVLDSHQRRGIGRELVRFAVARLVEAGHGALLIWVLNDNPARAFYAALGGQPVREQPLQIGSAALLETAYAWTDMRILL
jgi:GNAT superfamily N-acetyltransferase